MLLLLFALAAAEDDASILASNAKFSKDLLNALSKDENLIFSPFSLHTLLSLSYQGSAGHTRETFASALNLPPPEDTAESYKRLLGSIKNVQDVTLTSANKVYLSDRFNLSSSFAKNAVENFDAETETVDFSDAQRAADSMNSWVERKTNQKIRNLVSAGNFNAATVLVLLNAIYLKGEWLEQFKLFNTKKMEFFVNAKLTKQVDMMRLYGKTFRYFDDDQSGAQFLELPYVDLRTAMIIALPHEKDGLRRLYSVDLATILGKLERESVNVVLPKFKIESTLDLQEPLSNLGLQEIFTAKANFSEMTDNSADIVVSRVVQKAFLEVNEAGSEAAASSEMDYELKILSVPRQRPIYFAADHPFLFYIVHYEGMSANILFSGQVYSP